MTTVIVVAMIMFHLGELVDIVDGLLAFSLERKRVDDSHIVSIVLLHEQSQAMDVLELDKVQRNDLISFHLLQLQDLSGFDVRGRVKVHVLLVLEHSDGLGSLLAVRGGKSDRFDFGFLQERNEDQQLMVTVAFEESVLVVEEILDIVLVALIETDDFFEIRDEVDDFFLFILFLEKLCECIRAAYQRK